MQRVLSVGWLGGDATLQVVAAYGRPLAERPGVVHKSIAHGAGRPPVEEPVLEPHLLKDVMRSLARDNAARRTLRAPQESYTTSTQISHTAIPRGASRSFLSRISRPAVSCSVIILAIGRRNGHTATIREMRTRANSTRMELAV